MSGRLILLSTTPRVPAGLLSAEAWDALRGADRVFTAAADHPQIAPLRAAGVRVEVLSQPSAALARSLLDAAAAATIVWLVEPDDEPALAAELAAGLVGGPSAELEVLPGSYDLPGGHLLDLVEVMDRLRSPGGCPWDAEQTHASLLPYLLEEAYEVVEAVENADSAHLAEELGDLLLQVAFHARIAAERSADDGGFTIDDVADGIVAKLVNRHPHVFGADQVPMGHAGAAHVASRWEEIKSTEKARESVLDGIPPGLPALAYASKVLARARRAGLPEPTDAGVGSDADDALGAALLSAVVAAGESDAEGALRRATRRYVEFARAAERSTRAR